MQRSAENSSARRRQAAEVAGSRASSIVSSSARASGSGRVAVEDAPDRVAVDQLRDPVQVASHHGRAAGQRLEQHQPERLRVGRQRGDPGLAVCAGQRGAVVHVAHLDPLGSGGHVVVSSRPRLREHEPGVRQRSPEQGRTPPPAAPRACAARRGRRRRRSSGSSARPGRRAEGLGVDPWWDHPRPHPEEPLHPIARLLD